MDARRQADGSSWTASAVARELRERGRTVSRQYISKLANEGGDPGWDIIKGFAELFGVSTDEFREGPSSSPQSQLTGLMYRAGQLNADKIDEVARFIEWKEHEQRRQQ